MIWFLRLLIRQAEHEQRAFAGSYHVLLAVHSVTDRAAGVGSAQVGVPQQLTSLGVEGHEIAVHPAAENQVPSRREDAAFGEPGHLEVPFPLAGFGIKRADSAEAFLFRA